MRNRRMCSRNSHPIMTLMAMAIAFLSLPLGGCDNNDLVVDNNTANEVNFFDLAYDSDGLSKRTDISDIQVSWFDSRVSADQGGIIAFAEGLEAHAFVVVAGSISADTTIKVEVSRIETTDGNTSFVYEFGPDGLVFSRPAVLRLNVRELFGASVSAMSLYGLDEDAGVWMHLGTYHADAQDIVCAPIGHFSDYGAAGKCGGEEEENKK